MQCLITNCVEPPRWQLPGGIGTHPQFVCEMHKLEKFPSGFFARKPFIPIGESNALSTNIPPLPDHAAYPACAEIRGITHSELAASDNPEMAADARPAAAPARSWRSDRDQTDRQEVRSDLAPSSTGSLPVRFDLAHLAWGSAGAQAFTDRQQAILRAPVDPNALAIRPTGELYLPQVFYRQRLLDAFGSGGWAALPLSEMLIQENVAMGHYVLIAEGHIIGEAVGEMPVIPQNRRQTTAQLKEGCKSDAITRICKDLGIAWECWDHRFAQEWKSRFALRVWRARRQGWEWRRTDSEPFPDENRPGRGTESEYSKSRDFNDDAREHLISIQGEKHDQN